MGPEIATIAEYLGKPLAAWQRLVADVAGELDEHGRPWYRIIVVTIMRQHGKTTLILPWQVHRCFAWATPQRVVYTAQNRGSARDKLLTDQVPMLEASPFGAMGRVVKSNGHEAWEWHNGSRIGLLSNTKRAGHGFTNGLVTVDEAFAQTDWRVEQSLAPTQITLPDAQWLTVSTAGDETSVYLLDQVRRGRHVVESGRDEHVCYVEFSIPMDADIDDPAVWHQFMPMLGVTITEEALRTERTRMADFEFRRAFGNQWTEGLHSADAVVAPADWEAMARPTGRRDPDGRGRLAIDVAPDQSSASIGISVEMPDGTRHIEALETRPGMSWAPARAAEILSKPGRDQFENTVALSLATSGAIVPALEQLGLNVSPVAAQDWNAACASFLDGTREKTYVHINDPVLNEAVASAAQSFAGDAWHWKRRGEAPITPLCAVTLADWALVKASESYDVLASFY